jgi:hypothetical protein
MSVSPLRLTVCFAFCSAIVGLVDASAKSCNDKGPWIGCALEKELVLLARSQRKCVIVTGSVEGCHDTQNPLMLLLLELHLRLSPLFIFRGCVLSRRCLGARSGRRRRSGTVRSCGMLWAREPLG